MAGNLQSSLHLKMAEMLATMQAASSTAAASAPVAPESVVTLSKAAPLTPQAAAPVNPEPAAPVDPELEPESQANDED